MPRRGKRLRLAKGIFRDATGIAVILPTVNAQGKPSQEERRHPADADLGKLKAWREAEIKKRKKRQAAGLAPAGTFAADAQTYLAAVTALPRYGLRCAEIAFWVALFGERRRDTILPVHIRAIRDRWLTVGPKKVQVRGQGWVEVPEPLSASSVAKRMRALENLWTVLDGKKADNPVRDVPEPDEETATPRDVPYDVIRRIFQRMPSQHPMTARCKIMAYAGLAQSELARVDRSGIRLDRAEVWVPGRKKGRGAKGGVVPLSPEAMAAFQLLIALDAVGPFHASSLYHFFKRYAIEAGYPDIYPYQLRHSFFGGVQAASKDERAVALVSRHASRKTLRRYTEGAAHPAARAAVALFADGTHSNRAMTVPAFAVGDGRSESELGGAGRHGDRRNAQ